MTPVVLDLKALYPSVVPAVALSLNEEDLVARALGSVCRAYSIAASERENIRHYMIVGLLEARRRLGPIDDESFNRRVWKRLLGAAIDGMRNDSGVSATDWRRGHRKPRRFGEGEEFVSRRDMAPDTAHKPSIKVQKALTVLVEPLRRLGGLLEKIHNAIRIECRSVDEVAQMLSLDRGLVRRLLRRADIIVRTAAAQPSAVTRPTFTPTSDMEVQMDKLVALDAIVSQLRARVHIFASQFVETFDDAAVRKHLEASRAAFDAGDPVTGKRICRQAHEVVRLQLDLSRMEFILKTARCIASAEERQMKLFVE